MAPVHNCCSCIRPYDLYRSGRHALCLPCGHSTCRSCLLQLQTPNCPICHESLHTNIATMAPNYMLHDVLASSPATAVSWAVTIIYAGTEVLMRFECHDGTSCWSYSISGKTQQHSIFSSLNPLRRNMEISPFGLCASYHLARHQDT